MKQKWQNKSRRVLALMLTLGILSGNVLAWDDVSWDMKPIPTENVVQSIDEETAAQAGLEESGSSQEVSGETAETPTAVPQESATPAPTSTPEPSALPSTATPEPVASVVPEQTALPEISGTPAPAATATPAPSETPVVTATPEPETSAIPEIMDGSEIREHIDEIVAQTSEIGWMSEEELKQFAQEIREFQELLEQQLTDSQREELEEELTRLSNAAAAVQEVCNVWDALHNGTLSELDQSGKENSWRYQNGTLVEQDEIVPYANVQLESETGNYWGIDVSHHQGTIDWDAVKSAGVDFAIIRCGYGSDYWDQDDKQWRANVEACERLGIPYGVYLYSYATSLDQARSEAAHALRLLEGTSPSLPVFIDLEEPRTQVLGGEMITQIADTFCSILQQNGYKTGVYASLSWWEYYFQDWFTSNSDYYHWIAHWSSSCGYDGRYEIWQYDNSGSVSGINGRVDLNYWYGSSLNVYDDRYDEERYASVYDYDYYMAHNGDLAGMNRVQAIHHFVDYGMAEGRIASASFSPFVYRAKYLDLYNAYGNDLVKYYEHYMNCGGSEGRTAGVNENYKPLTVYQGVDYSPIYNYNYYVTHNGDVAQMSAGNDYLALQHFVNCGMAEGRNGNEEFDVHIYANKYVDIYNAFGYDWDMCYMHYLKDGFKEGRSAKASNPDDRIHCYQGVDYSSVYSYEEYLKYNSDVAAAVGENDYLAIQHFVNSGMAEARLASSEFSPYIYRAKYMDVYTAFQDDIAKYYMHFIRDGKAENRTAAIDEEYTHLTVYDGVDYSLVYNYLDYIAYNVDVAVMAHGDDYLALQHFVKYGMAEGRSASKAFDVHRYVEKYPDIKQAFGEDWYMCFMHYIKDGYNEGRTA